MLMRHGAAVCFAIGFVVSSAHAAPPVATSADSQVRTATRHTGAETPDETDLMMQALTAERGESPNAARIEKVSAQVRAESKRKRATVTTVWHDPFAPDPEQGIVVQMPAPRKQRGNELSTMRRELARARAETAVAQADAAAAQAEAARAKANIARTEASAARVQAMAAKQEAAAARAECVETGRGRRSTRARTWDDRDGLGRFAVTRRVPSTSTSPRGFASKTRGQRSVTRKKVSAAEIGIPADDRPVPPASIESLQATPAGIVVVPIGR